MSLRLSVPPTDPDPRLAMDGVIAGEVGDPIYGLQLQDFAVPGLDAEGRMVIDYADMPVTLGDGTVMTLRKPSYSVADLAYGLMADDVMISPRIANPMIGLGLVEAFPEETFSPMPIPMIATAMAGMATIRSQSAAAFAGDIGISTPLIYRMAIAPRTSRSASLCLLASSRAWARGRLPFPSLIL